MATAHSAAEPMNLSCFSGSSPRVEIDDSDDRMQKKIRTASKQKIPFVLIAGATDAEAGAVSFRYRDGSQRNGVPVDDAVAQIADWITARHNVDPSAEGEPEGQLDGMAAG